MFTVRLSSVITGCGGNDTTTIPSLFQSFIPQYSGGLCDAVIMMPQSKFLAAYARVGVGTIPTRVTLHPADNRPEIKACSIISPDVLGSRAITADP